MPIKVSVGHYTSVVIDDNACVMHANACVSRDNALVVPANVCVMRNNACVSGDNALVVPAKNVFILAKRYFIQRSLPASKH